MTRELTRNIKLGVFVMAGTAFLIAILYLMGEKKNLFGSTFRLSAEFHNVNGLMEGNNVRFAGIDVGTVESVEINSDSSVLVVMIIEKRVQKFIKKDAVAAVGTDGLMGNKLININASGMAGGSEVADQDRLKTVRPIETDEMIRTLNTTNDNIRDITADLRKITQKINSRNTLWSLLMDTVVADNVKQAIVNIKITGSRSAVITGDLQKLVESARQGRGLVASLLTDTVLPDKLESTFVKLDHVSDKMATLSGDMSQLSERIQRGEGTIGMLVTDTGFVRDLKSAVKHANTGASGFSENMEALKHSVFLRKYFRKKEKESK